MYKTVFTIFTLVYLLICSSFGHSQPPMGSRNEKMLNYRGFAMKHIRWEGGLSVGIANSVTDIAPKKANEQPSLFDFYSRGISPALTLHTRYRFNNTFSTKANLGALMLRGNDKWSQDIAVVNRGKSFTNNIFEASLLGEIYLPKGNIQPKRDLGQTSFDYFLFAGISGFYHSPELLGPVIDEFDQNLIDAQNVYNNYQVAVPLGAGIQWTVSNQWVFGVDFNFRYTFFDYLDGFKRPNSTRNDFFFSSGFSVGYILASKSKEPLRTKAPHVFKKESDF